MTATDVPGTPNEAAAEAQAAMGRGDVAAAIAGQERAVALARARGEAREALVSLSVLLYNLATYYAYAGRHDDAVRVLEEVVALDERTGHPDLASDRQTLERARQAAALTPEEQARLLQMAPVVQLAPVEELARRARDAAQGGDFRSAIDGQEQAIALARSLEAERDVPAAFSALLYNLANYYGNVGRFDEAVAALEEVVAIDQRTAHPDLESDREALERARRMAALTPEEHAQLADLARQMQDMAPEERVALLDRTRRAQIEALADEARDAAIAVRQGEAAPEPILEQLENIAAQAVDGEAPESPWHDLAAFLRAVAACLREDPLPHVPAAYAERMQAVQAACVRSK